MSVAFPAERNSAINRSDLADLNALVVVAEHLSFRGASVQLGITASALSHSMRLLEERLGVRLLHRTTRSVSLTDAGLRQRKRLRPAIEEISGALDTLHQGSAHSPRTASTTSSVCPALMVRWLAPEDSSRLRQAAG